MTHCFWEETLCTDKFYTLSMVEKAEKQGVKLILANEIVNGTQWRDIKRS